MCLPCAFHLGSVDLGKSLTEWIELFVYWGKAPNRHFTEDGVVSGARGLPEVHQELELS